MPTQGLLFKLMKLFVLLIATTLLVQCGDGEEAGEYDFSSDSGGDNPPVGKTDESAFYVRVYDEGNFLFHMKKNATFGTECSIDSTASSEDAVCQIDVMEGDLYFHGLKFQYNAPSDLCTYVARTPYWYYNDEVGYGPETITLNVTKDTDNNITAFTCNVDGVASCTGLDEVSIDQTNESVTCVYDRSGVDEPNCCFGDYTLTVNTTISGNTTTTVKDQSWGGDWGSCIGGAGRVDSSPKTKLGLPTTMIEYTEGTGLNTTYEVPGAIKSPNNGENFLISNFYTPADHSHSGFVSASTSTLPYAVVPIDDRNGTLIPAATGAFVWACLDDSWEIKHRISVYVQEWNTMEEFLSYGTSSGVSGDPDVVGSEGTDCDYDSFGASCNDMSDWDDLVDALGGSYDTTTPTNRILFFPSENY